MLWAFARLGHNPGHQLLDSAAKFVTHNVSQFAPQVRLNSRWRFAHVCVLWSLPEPSAHYCQHPERSGPSQWGQRLRCGSLCCVCACVFVL